MHGTKLFRSAESASSNIVLYSPFIWLNGSITLIRAETERYDVVRFSKVATNSLASGIGRLRSQMNEVRAKLQVNFDPGQGDPPTV